MYLLLLLHRISHGASMPIHLLFDFQDEDGNKMINEYVRVRKIGSGSYGKVVSVNLIYNTKQSF